jgi:hypothetical protein
MRKKIPAAKPRANARKVLKTKRDLKIKHATTPAIAPMLYRAQSTLTLEERLAKYTISRERYDNETARLLVAGFTLQQADKIILRRSSKNAVEGVLNLHTTLLSAPYQFTFEQIAAMASNNGGAKAIKMVIASHTSLENLGFSHEQIAVMASNEGGAQAMKTVIASHAPLRNLGFSHEQIAAIASNKGGAQAMKMVIASYTSLRNLGFSHERIVAMASNDGSAQAMKMVIASYTLLRNLDFSNEQTAVMASNHGGAQALKTVITSHTSLQNLGFSNEQITAMASNFGGAQAMKTAIALHTSLRNLGFSHEQITAMASNNGGAQAMKTMIASYASLENLSFSHEQIAAMASNGGGAQAIKAVIKHYPELSSHGYSLEFITALAARIGGATKIKKTNERINFVNEYLGYQPTAEIPQNPVHTTDENNAHEPTIMNFALDFRSDFILDQQAITSSPQSIEKSHNTMDDFVLFEYDFEASEALPSNSQILKQQGLFATSNQRKRNLDNAEENTSDKTEQTHENVSKQNLI